MSPAGIVEMIESLIAPHAAIAALVAAGFALLLGALAAVLLTRLRRLRRAHEVMETERAAARAEAERLRTDLAESQGVVEDVLEIAEAGRDVWRRSPVDPPEGHRARLARSIPVLVVANLKGGVGKTTLAANLAGHFDARGERVLLVDLDYQGSLSAMATGGGARGRDLTRPGAMRLLAGRWADPVPIAGATSNSALVDCYYPLFNEESRLLQEWLMGLADDDARFRLSRVLQGERVQTTFDRVIVDTGPRVTLGLVNALTAATHLIVPTQLNGLAIEATNSFLFTWRQLAAHLPTGIRAHRVVGMQKAMATDRLTTAERDAVHHVEAVLAAHGDPADVFLRDAMVPSRTAFARAAGHAIAYVSEPGVRPAMDALGARIAEMAPAETETAA